MRYPVDNNYAIFIDEFERKSLKAGVELGKAETASKLLDLGIARDVILNAVGKDEIWLEKLEAEHKKAG
jgi:hypothetical protein